MLIHAFRQSAIQCMPGPAGALAFCARMVKSVAVADPIRHPVNFRNFADLERVILANLSRIPRDVDLVVGVPRSGLLAAVPVALHLNVALTDVEGFVAGREYGGGFRASGTRGTSPFVPRRVLVIDDSVETGREMRRVRERIAASPLAGRVLYAAVFAAPGARAEVDLHFDVCDLPRVFAWNVMHHPQLKHACVDIDGVLCLDPTDAENDDGPKYHDFTCDAAPFFLPTLPVGALVTSRLEKYREATAGWLSRHKVQYGELVMLDLPDMESRRKLGIHGRFKADVFRKREWASFFVESAPWQAAVIANEARKPVICIQDFQLYLPSTARLAKGAVKKIPGVGARMVGRAGKWLYERLLRANRWGA